MQVEVGDRLVLHGKHGTRIGVVVERTEAGSVVRWADGGENVVSAGSDAPEANTTWEAAKAAPGVSWRRGITAGVGHEASLRQAKLAREAQVVEATDGEPVVEPEAVEHRPAAGE